MPSEETQQIKRFRDLAIDAALRRVILGSRPDISEKEIQERGGMEIGEGRYVVTFDDRPFALIELESDHRFSLTLIASPVSKP